MSVLICRREKVEHPFYLEHLGIHVHSSQELCYCIFHHPILFQDHFVSEELLQFIRADLDMGYTAAKMERAIKAGEREDTLLLIFMQDCDYYSQAELAQFKQMMAALKKLPAHESACRLADYFARSRQYGKAIKSYESLLTDADKRMEGSFIARIWYQLGVCYARIFRFDKAMDAFSHSYLKKKDSACLEKMYLLTRLDPELTVKEFVKSDFTPEKEKVWDDSFTAAGEEALRSPDLQQLYMLFDKDSIRRGEGMNQLVEKWKKEYRSMV